MVKRTIEKINSDDLWESIAKNYEFIEGAQMSNSFIILMALNKSEPLSTTQISEKIAVDSKGQLFKVSGALKDSLENRLRKAGYVDGTDIPNEKTDRKPIRMTLYSITPKGIKLLKGWLAFLSAL
jgi:DNA-binding PadR family transcriptional regulator